MSIPSTRSEGPTRRAGVRWLVLLCGLVLIAAGLGSVPAAAEDHDAEKELEGALQKAYGDIGCRLVEGFNDRCPTLVSDPAIPGPDPDDSRMCGPRQCRDYFQTLWSSRLSPDGKTLYGIGWQHHDVGSRDLIGVWIVAYDVTSGQIAHEFRPRVLAGAVHELPQAVEISGDGRRLYLAGYSYVPSDSGTSATGFERRGWVAGYDTTTGAELWMSESTTLLGLGLAGQQAEWSWVPRMTVAPNGNTLFLKVQAVPVMGPLGVLGNPTREVWHVAVSAQSGERIWATNVGLADGENSTTRGRGLAVAPDGSRLFSQTELTTKGPGAAFPVQHVVAAYNATTGALEWQNMFSTTPFATQSDIMVSPDGRSVYAAGELYGQHVDPDTGDVSDDWRMQVNSYDAATGNVIWEHEYRPLATGCSATNGSFTSSRLVMSPDASLLYFAGWAYHFGIESGGACPTNPTVRRYTTGAVVWAVTASNGAVEWDAFRSNSDGGSWANFCGKNDGDCHITVVPGLADKADRSQVLITGWRKADPDHARGYVMTLAFDGATGDFQWQGRYLDTFNDNDTDLSVVRHLTGGDSIQVSPDGAQIHILAREKSGTREWDDDQMAHQVITYNARPALPDLIPTSLNVVRDPHGQTTLTVTVANDGLADAENVVVRFFNGDTVLGDSNAVSVEMGESASLSLIVPNREIAPPHDLHAAVNPDRTVSELDYDNNRIQQE